MCEWSGSNVRVNMECASRVMGELKCACGPVLMYE